MELKVCGMKYDENIKDVAALQPDYLGFIFWEHSKRYFKDPMPHIPNTIKKVGVFVDATIEEVILKVKKYRLQAVQLHGEESPEYCKKLKHELLSSKHGVSKIDIIKVFSIRDDFDFNLLTPYESIADFYLFDTKGALPGGNGYTFNWELLKNYPSTKPYFLSGGIGLTEVENIAAFLEMPASKYCQVIDVNSKFEIEPGLKNVSELKEFRKTVN